MSMRDQPSWKMMGQGGNVGEKIAEDITRLATRRRTQDSGPHGARASRRARIPERVLRGELWWLWVTYQEFGAPGDTRVEKVQVGAGRNGPRARPKTRSPASFLGAPGWGWFRTVTPVSSSREPIPLSDEANGG